MMEEIKRQVSKARRRMIAEQFLRIVTWSMFGVLMVAAIALIVPKLTHVPFAGDTWTWSWIGGSIAAGLVLASTITYLRRRTDVDAAIEIDRRFGLKERVASTMTLQPSELETEAGQALMSDAGRRVGRIEVGEKFGLGVSWKALLPALPALVLIAAVLLPNATQEVAEASAPISRAQKAAIEKAKEKARQMLEERKKKTAASKKSLAEIEALVKKVEKQLDGMKNDNKADRKKTMVKFNDLSKSLQKEKEKLGDPENAKKALEQLKKLDKGPADKLGQALKEGDFKQAMKELDELAKKLEKGELNADEKKQLEKQVNQMKEKLNQLAKDHEQAKKDLEKEIEKRKRKGDLAGAAEMQKKLEKLQKQDQQMQNLNKMAQACEKCQNAMKQGDPKAAADAMKQMAQQLQEMEDELAEMEAVDELMQQIADAKEACQQCNGEGDGMDQEFQEGMQFAQGRGQGRGNGLGEGEGYGDRPEEKTATGSIDSQVKGNPTKGEVVRIGEADGPNRAGVSLASINDEIDAERTKEFDPTLNQRLPKAEREQSNEYLEKFRTGE